VAVAVVLSLLLLQGQVVLVAVVLVVLTQQEPQVQPILAVVVAVVADPVRQTKTAALAAPV
jgi:hypothetical protein